jgi:hypothetical protein
MTKFDAPSRVVDATRVHVGGHGVEPAAAMSYYPTQLLDRCPNGLQSVGAVTEEPYREAGIAQQFGPERIGQCRLLRHAG